MALPKDYNARKALPLFTFLTEYFPDAVLELVKVSVAGNVQHNPGEKMHWARGKSMDQLNTAMRHIFDHGMGNVYDEEPPEVLAAIGDDGTMHLAKAAWRVMAEIQLLCEKRDDARRQSKSSGRSAAKAARGLLSQARAERDGGTRARLPRRAPRVRVRDRDQGPRKGTFT